jgi:hypothetical protein
MVGSRVTYHLLIQSHTHKSLGTAGLQFLFNFALFYFELQRTLFHRRTSKCSELPADADGRAAALRHAIKWTLHQNLSIGIQLFCNVLMWVTEDHRLPPLDLIPNQIAISHLRHDVTRSIDRLCGNKTYMCLWSSIINCCGWTGGQCKVASAILIRAQILQCSLFVILEQSTYQILKAFVVTLFNMIFNVTGFSRNDFILRNFYFSNHITKVKPRPVTWWRRHQYVLHYRNILNMPILLLHDTVYIYTQGHFAMYIQKHCYRCNRLPVTTDCYRWLSTSYFTLRYLKKTTIDTTFKKPHKKIQRIGVRGIHIWMTFLHVKTAWLIVPSLLKT